MLDLVVLKFLPADFENLVRSNRFDRLEDFREGEKHRFGIRIIGFHLGLDEEVDMIRHDAGGVEMDLA